MKRVTTGSSWTTLVAVALVLVGCATTPDNPTLSPEAVEPLVCKGKDQCDLYWQRAQVWVATNSTYRIQIANDTLIETYGPFGSKVDLAYRITKVPSTKDEARITILANCDKFIRCYPTRTDAIVSFKRFVRQADSIVTPTVGRTAAPPQATSKYSYVAEQFAKANGCEVPIATLNFVSSGAETFGVACAKGEPMTVRCELGQCRVLK